MTTGTNSIRNHSETLFPRPVVTTQEMDARIIRLSLDPPKFISGISDIKGMCCEMVLLSSLWDPVIITPEREAENRDMIFFFQAVGRHFGPMKTFLEIHEISNTDRNLVSSDRAEKIARQMKFFMQRISHRENNIFGCELDTETLAGIVELDFSGFGFQFLPNGIDVFKNLRILKLGNNNLAKLPDSIGNLKKLEYLDLRGNLIQELPESLTECSALAYLNIAGNTIPPSCSFAREKARTGAAIQIIF
jgi:Leucine-rich repeat (LRR) protein